jgi:hypothetical protein
MPHMIFEPADEGTQPFPNNPRRVYVSRPEAPKVAADMAVLAGRSLGRHFAIETGAVFHQYTRFARHTPQFEFREGRPIQRPGPESRSFDYKLNAYGGSASVSLRVESRSNSPLPGNERFSPRIESTESLQVIRVPLIGVARFGAGRFRGVARAGVTGGFFVKNELSIEVQAPPMQRVRPIAGQSHTITYDRQQRFLPGYLLSAGLEYQFARRFVLFVSPSFSGDFSRTDTERGKLPGQSSFGLNMGGMVYF